jgi:toxin ParE1/3/4
MRRRLRLEWSAYALADRTAIFDYIEADSPQAAIEVDNRIREQVEMLARFPQSGRQGRIEGTRELVISRTPYIAAYRLTSIPPAWCEKSADPFEHSLRFPRPYFSHSLPQPNCVTSDLAPQLESCNDRRGHDGSARHFRRNLSH